MCKCELVCSQIYINSRILLFVLSFDFYVGAQGSCSRANGQEIQTASQETKMTINATKKDMTSNKNSNSSNIKAVYTYCSVF